MKKVNTSFCFKIMLLTLLCANIVFAQKKKKGSTEEPYGKYEKSKAYKTVNIPSCYLFPDYAFVPGDMVKRLYHQFLGKDTIVVARQSAYPPFRMQGLDMYSFPEGKKIQENIFKRVSGLLGSMVYITNQLEVITWDNYFGAMGVYDGKTGRLVKVTNLLSDYSQKKIVKRTLLGINDKQALFFDERDNSFTILDYRTGSIVEELLPPAGYQFTGDFKMLNKSENFIFGIRSSKANIDSVRTSKLRALGNIVLANMKSDNNKSDPSNKIEVASVSSESYLLFNQAVKEQERKTGLLVYSVKDDNILTIDALPDSVLGKEPALLDFVVSANDSLIIARYDTPTEFKYVKYSLKAVGNYTPERILQYYGFKYNPTKVGKAVERVGITAAALLSSRNIGNAASILINNQSILLTNFPLIDVSPDGKYLVHKGYNYIPLWKRSNLITASVPPGGTSIIDLVTGEIVHYHCNDQVSLSYPVGVRGLYFLEGSEYLVDYSMGMNQVYSFERLKTIKENLLLR